MNSNQQYPQRNFTYASEGIVVCSKCSILVPYEELPYIRSKQDGARLSYCKSCRKKQGKNSVYYSEESFFHYKEVSLRKDARRTKRVILKRTFDLPDGYLLALWKVQEHKCFYTGKELEVSSQTLRNDLITVDRVDTKKSYVVGNVVIASNRANMMKGGLSLQEVEDYLPVWHQAISEKLDFTNNEVQKLLLSSNE
jgi:hypothetical protein